jgi:hypothetical protein
MMINDDGHVLWRFAGGQITNWRIGKLRKMLRAIYPHFSDAEIEQKIFRYFVPEEYFFGQTKADDLSE